MKKGDILYWRAAAMHRIRVDGKENATSRVDL